jgi:tetratricopeptide (TPR) repeat protein
LKLNLDESRKIGLGAAAVFLISQIIYLLGLTRTCPFWDSGEFIATGYTLGIPHPPGTPFYVLIARLMSFLPFGSIAARINYLSALASSAAVVFAYLVVVEVFKWQQRGKPDSERLPIELGIIGAIAGGLFTAFTRTFWENALEAETYGLASLAVIAALYLTFRWAGKEGSNERNNKLFVLAYYLVAVSGGVYFGSFLIVPAMILFVYLVDHRALAPSYFGALVIAGVLVGLQPAMLPSLKGIWVVLLALGLVGSLVLGKYWSPLGPRGVVFWCLLLALIGLTNHLYLPIRAHLDPNINEADPSTWHHLWLALIRDQYKPVDPFTTRNASWAIQFNKHFWRYFHDQWQLSLRPLWLANGLPLLVGLVGMVTHAKREKKTFLAIFTFFLINTVGLVFYLNFRDEEVRDRDYFFTMSYQAFALWIGLGFVALASWIRWAFAESRGKFDRALPWAVALLGPVLAISTCANYYHLRDRHGFYLARDLAYNMLQPLERNALLFTNGDNDTFPLWYIQEVEHFRTDVRILNLSLLNTDWYVRQLRDYSPKVDIGWTDKEIEAVRAVPEKFVDYAQGVTRKDQYVSYLRANKIEKYVPDPDEFIYSKDIASRRIIEREYGKKPIYFAVTVPDQMGFTNRLTMEGIVFRFGDAHKGKEEAIDVDKTLNNLNDVYLYRGLLNKDHTYDNSVYKDDNAQKLVQNYAAGYIRAAEQLIDDGRNEEALRAADQASEMSNSISVIYSCGVVYYRTDQFDKAEKMFRELVSMRFGDFPVIRLLGRSIERQGRMEEAEKVYLEGYNAYPDDRDALTEVFSFFMEQGRKTEALQALDTWVRRHPADEAARKRLAQLRDSL